jgi:hypothetical protein
MRFSPDLPSSGIIVVSGDRINWRVQSSPWILGEFLMLQEPSSLQQVRVASPCRASWDKMTGDEQVRFCHQCEHFVYNLSAMPKSEAENLLRSAQNSEKNLCIRFYRRADGTILTEDCPIGFSAVRRRGLIMAAGAFLAGLLAWASAALTRENRPVARIYSWQETEPAATLLKWLKPTRQPRVFMGKKAI